MEDDQLIDSFRKGNDHSFRLLVERHKNYVFTIVSTIVKDYHLAEETSQDVFVKVYKQINRFEGQSKFSTWLYRIAVNTALNKVKKKIKKVEWSEEVNEKEVSDLEGGFKILVKQDRRNVIQSVLEKMDEVDSLIITLFYLEERNIEEVSKILDLSIGNTKVRLFRARKKMKKFLPNYISS